MGDRSAGPSRLIQLDILRGIAILLVLGRHQMVEPKDGGVFYPFAAAWHRIGWTGVDLFFVLSGFLIGGLLFAELRRYGRIDVRRFMIRRGFKIWPSYYLYLLALLVIETTLTGPPRRSPTALAWMFLPCVLNVQNYVEGTPLHLWSLGVEEHFYLVLPFVLWWLARPGREGGGRIDGPGRLPALAFGVILACTAWRCVNAREWAYAPFTHHYPTHLRIDGLAFGVLLAYLLHFRPTAWGRLTRHRGPLLVLGLSLVAPMIVISPAAPFGSSIGLSCLYLGYGSILIAFLGTTPGAGMGGRLMQSPPARLVAFAGTYSYSIYLWHLDLAGRPLEALMRRGWLAGPPGTSRWLALTGAFLVLSTVAGIVMGRLIERPALALRERLFPSRAASPRPSDPPAATPSGGDPVVAPGHALEVDAALIR